MSRNSVLGGQMIVLIIPNNQKDDSDIPHLWRQMPDKRPDVQQVEHLPSLDHDGEDQPDSAERILRQKSR